MTRRKGEVRAAAIEQRFAVRVRIRIPERGLVRLNEVFDWLDARVGRLGYRVWKDCHAPWGEETTAIFLDDPKAAADLVAAFELDLAPDAAARAFP